MSAGRGRNTDLSRAQKAIVQHEAFGHHLNDLTRFCAGNWRFEHRLMKLGIKLITGGRADWPDAMLCHDIGQLTQRKINAFN